MTSISHASLEALAGELGAVAARIEREVQLRVTAALSACDVRLAAVDAQVAELRAAAAQSELRAQNAERVLAENVAARLAELKDGEPGSIGPEGPPGESVKGDKGDQGDKGDAGDDGVSVSGALVDEMGVLVLTLSDGTELRAGKVSGPPGESVKGDPGEPGQDVDPDQVRAMVRAIVAVEVEQAVKLRPVPADGHTPTEAELVPLVEAAVSRAFAVLPKPKDGQDGRSVEPAEVERMIVEAAAKLPPAEQGVPGKSAYELAVQAGFSGNLAAWLESLRGPPGDKGDAGDSVKGDPGPPGTDGAPGMLPLVKAWESGVTYRAEVKTHRGALWQAARDTGTEPGGEDWICLAMSGRSLRPRGLWDAEAEYRYLDLVQRDGAMFMALQDDPGACPGDGWQLAARQGKPGRPGDKGDRGERGLPAPPVPLPPLRMFMEGDTVLVAEFGEHKTSVDLYDVLRETQRGVSR